MKNVASKAVSIEVAHNSTIWCTVEPDKPVSNVFTLFISLEPYSGKADVRKSRVLHSAGGGEPTVTITEPEFCSFMKDHTLTPSGELAGGEYPWTVTVDDETVTIEYVADTDEYPVADFLPYCFICDDFVMLEDEEHKIGWHRCSYNTDGFEDVDDTIADVTTSAWYQVKKPVELTFDKCSASNNAMCVSYTGADGQTYYVTGTGQKLLFDYELETQGNTTVGVYYGEELLSADLNTPALIKESGTYVIRADNGYVNSIPVRVFATDWRYIDCESLPDVDFINPGTRLLYSEADTCYYIYADGGLWKGALKNGVISWERLADICTAGTVCATDYYENTEKNPAVKKFFAANAVENGVNIVCYDIMTGKSTAYNKANTSYSPTKPMSLKVSDVQSVLQTAAKVTAVSTPFDMNTFADSGVEIYIRFKPDGSTLRYLAIDTALFRKRIITAVLIENGNFIAVPLFDGSALDDFSLIDVTNTAVVAGSSNGFSLTATVNDLYVTVCGKLYSFRNGEREWFPGQDEPVIMGADDKGLIALSESGRLWYLREEI
jgi:hypothetical protein